MFYEAQRNKMYRMGQSLGINLDISFEEKLKQGLPFDTFFEDKKHSAIVLRVKKKDP